MWGRLYFVRPTLVFQEEYFASVSNHGIRPDTKPDRGESPP